MRYLHPLSYHLPLPSAVNIPSCARPSSPSPLPLLILSSSTRASLLSLAPTTPRARLPPPLPTLLAPLYHSTHSPMSLVQSDRSALNPTHNRYRPPFTFMHHTFAHCPFSLCLSSSLFDVQRIRWGRGVGSGKGKTAGRGHKGSHARNAPGLKPWFIGGQTPLYKLFPKRGFKQREKRVLDTLNLNTLQRLIAQQRIDASQPITMRTLRDCGAVAANIQHGVKLLAAGYHTARDSPPLPALHIEVSDVSASAKRAVEAAGGSVRLVWYNRLGLRYLLKPHKLAQPPRREAIPPPKYRVKYEAQQAGGERVRSKMGDVLQ